MQWNCVDGTLQLKLCQKIQNLKLAPNIKKHRLNLKIYFFRIGNIAFWHVVFESVEKINISAAILFVDITKHQIRKLGSGNKLYTTSLSDDLKGFFILTSVQ